MADKTGTETCAICAKMFKQSYINTHKRRAHNIYGGTSGRIRQEVSLRYQHDQEQQTDTTQVTFTVMPMMILQDSGGTLWIAEKLDR